MISMFLSSQTSISLFFEMDSDLDSKWKSAAEADDDGGKPRIAEQSGYAAKLNQRQK